MEISAFFQHVTKGDEGVVRAALDAEPGLARLAWEPVRDGAVWEHGVTALHIAVRQGDSGLVELLLARGADPDARTRTGEDSRTALHDSYECGREPITKLLLERGATYDISVAAARGDFARVTELLEEDPQLVNDPSNGLSPLGWAGYGQDAAMVPFLVERGAELRDELCCPSGTGRLDILRAFLAAGADPDGLSPGWEGRPLHVAAALRYSADNVPAARVLLDAGADVNGRAADGLVTPLDVADAVLRKAPHRRAGAEAMIAFLESRGGVRGRS